MSEPSKEAKPYRAKVGDWVATFVKVVAIHGKDEIVVRIGGSEATVSRSECWHPDHDRVERQAGEQT